VRTGAKSAEEGIKLASELFEEVLREGLRTLSEAARSEDLQGLVEDATGQLVRTLRWASTPAVDVYERSGEFVIVVEVPGAKPDDVSVRAGEDYVEVRAKLPRMREGRPRYRERVTGEVTRRIDLDAKIDPKGVKAECGDGLLVIRAPKVEEAEVKVRPAE